MEALIGGQMIKLHSMPEQKKIMPEVVCIILLIFFGYWAVVGLYFWIGG